MLIFGYIFIILNYVCNCASRFLKEKKNMLILNLLAKVFTVIGLYCFGSLTGSYNMMVTFVVIIVLNIRERVTDKKLSWLWLIFEIVYCCVLVLTYSGISSVLVFITSSVTLFHTWFLPPQLMRLIGACNSVVYLCYSLSIVNYAGILEIAIFLSNVISYRKYKEENKHK